MKVRFLKDVPTAGKPYKAGQIVTHIKPAMAKALWLKEQVEILDEHDFEKPKKKESKKDSKVNDKKEL